jgi:RimJ/RimL family protein N-acetyltransferase
MTEAVQAFSDWGLEHLDLVRIHAHCFATNPASARVLEKAGFAFEGRLRKAVCKGGEVLDALLYARVKEG